MERPAKRSRKPPLGRFGLLTTTNETAGVVPTESRYCAMRSRLTIEAILALCEYPKTT